jgi:hypothetical protein
MRVLIVCVVFLGRVVSAVETPPVLPPPSANAGKSGTYEVQTKSAGYSYFVCVPQSYSAQSAAGLHLFFHGQHGQGGASNFGLFQSTLLEPYCLIGINMAYADGDNQKDTAGKVAVAQQAVLQVMADYRIVPGRAVVGCFSGGGLPCGQWYAAAGKTRGLGWPFSVVALYGANFLKPVMPGPPTGWMVGLAKDEMGLGVPTLYASQTARFGEVLKLAPQLGPDQRFVLPEGGHGVHPPEVAATTRIFKRMDLLYGQFLVPADWSEKPLAPIIESANAGALGAAAQALVKLADGKVPAERRAALTALLDQRAQALVALVGDLVDADPLLASTYVPLAAERLKKHPREADLKPLVERLSKGRQRLAGALAAQKALAAGWGEVLAGGPRLNAKAPALLQQVIEASGATSEQGAMATELLALPVAAPASGPAKRQ